MADLRYLKKRRLGWYFQIAVPQKLRGALGKATITASLQTRDLNEALTRRWSKLVEVQELFARVERRPPSDEPLDPEALLELDEYARALYIQTLRTMQAEAHRGERAWGRAELEAAHTELFAAYDEGASAPVAELLSEYCSVREIVPASAMYRQVRDALLLARDQAVIGRLRALDGKTTNDLDTFLQQVLVDPVSLKPLQAKTSGRGGVTFGEAAHRFIAERQRDPQFALTGQTKEIYETAFRLFDSWAKQPTLDSVDRAAASRFLDTVAKLDPRWGRGPGAKKLSFAEIVSRFGDHPTGLSATTVNRYGTALALVWKHAEERFGYEGKNPWKEQSRSTVKRRGNSETDKRGFTPAEIGQLLARRPTVAPPKHNVASALPWLVLIAAYSAMRLNEICGLSVESVREADGLYYFNLTKAKTGAGVRPVPVHSKILDAGFLSYCDAVGGGSLWPALKPLGPDKKPSKYATKAFIKYRRALKLVDVDSVTSRDRLDFHSLRRSAITALRRARIHEDEVSELVGHEYGRQTYGGYADRQQLDRLKAVVEAIRYDSSI